MGGRGEAVEVLDGDLEVVRERRGNGDGLVRDRMGEREGFGVEGKAAEERALGSVGLMPVSRLELGEEDPVAGAVDWVADDGAIDGCEMRAHRMQAAGERLEAKKRITAPAGEDGVEGFVRLAG